MNEDEYLNNRLEEQLKWYSNKSQTNQKWYKRLRLTEIISASLIPFLAGMKDTIPMIDKTGRDSYLGERSKGHKDPGATSTYYIIRTFYEYVKEKAEKS